MVAKIIGSPVIGDDLFGREYELAAMWRSLEAGEHVVMLALRRVGKVN